MGISLPQLLAAPAVAATGTSTPLAVKLSGAMFGRARNVIFLWLQGGPPQHETFDPKPDAPVEIRGPFRPIQTNIPGTHFCELLPRTAQRADKLAIIRSLHTDDNNHDVSGYWVLTGYPYGPGSARQIKPTDWPYFGSVVKMLKPSERLPALTSVWIPDMMRLNDNVTPAGQTGGFLGSMWDPERFVGDPARPDYQIEGLHLPVDLPPERLQDRAGLLRQLNGSLAAGSPLSTGHWNRLSAFAMDLVTSGRAKAAFDLSREPEALRDRYGRHTWGQSCLLARRLVEAGVRLVHVNWHREPGDSAVDNPMWDTHALNADRLQDVLCPLFDVSFAALLDDLDDRGLLSETLVVAVGEFGRTPKINRLGGRDHWGPVFCCALAGAGIAGGQVLGASDRDGAYPAADPIRPHDLTATIYHLLGIPHDGVFYDRLKRPQLLTKGEPLHVLLGAEPATPARCQATGDESFVPPYDASLLVDTDFSAGRLVAVTPASRTKGWRGWPLTGDAGDGLRVECVPEPRPYVRIGIDPHVERVARGARALVAQEIRSARGGQYTFSVQLISHASNKQAFERWFTSACTCQLRLFRYTDTNKHPFEATVLASEVFQPVWRSDGSMQRFQVSAFLGSTVPGRNFPIGNGLGVALVLECGTDTVVPPGDQAWLALAGVQLDFSARIRDENVTV